MIELTLVKALKANAVLAGQFNNRLYACHLPENSAFPCLLVQNIINQHEQTYAGLSGEQQAQIQIDVWVSHPTALTSIKNTLIPLLANLKNNVEDHYILAVFELTERLGNIPKEHRLTLELTLHYKDSTHD